MAAAFGAREKAIEAQQAAMARSTCLLPATSSASSGGCARSRSDSKRSRTDLDRARGARWPPAAARRRASCRDGKPELEKPSLTLDLRVRHGDGGRLPGAVAAAASASSPSGPPSDSAAIRSAPAATPSSVARASTAAVCMSAATTPCGRAIRFGRHARRSWRSTPGVRCAASSPRRRATRAAVGERRLAGREPERGGAATGRESGLDHDQQLPGQGCRLGRGAGPDPNRAAHAQLGQVVEHDGGARPAHPGRLDRQLRGRRGLDPCSPRARARGCSSSAARAAPGPASARGRGRRRGSRQRRLRLWAEVGRASSSDPIARRVAAGAVAVRRR